MNNVSDVACLSHSRSPHPRQDKILNKKVLVVDDESLIRYSLKSFVEGEGFIAITADSALNALKSIEEANTLLSWISTFRTPTAWRCSRPSKRPIPGLSLL